MCVCRCIKINMSNVMILSNRTQVKKITFLTFVQFSGKGRHTPHKMKSYNIIERELSCAN